MANEVNIKFRVRGIIDQADTSSTTNSLVTKTKGADTVYEFTADYYKTFDAVSPKTVTLDPGIGGASPTLITTGTISSGDVIIFKNVSENAAEDVTLFSSIDPLDGFAEISPDESIFIVSDGSPIYGMGEGLFTANVHVIHFETTNPS
jgi:hypothetical protein